MTCRLIPLLAATLVATVAHGQTKFATLKAGGTTYSNVVVLGFSTTDLYFKHAKGIANVKLRLLSPEQQRLFEYDAAAAAAAERQQLENDVRYARAVAQSIETEALQSEPAAGGATWSDLALADPVGENSWINRTAPEITAQKWLGDTPNPKGITTLVVFWATTSKASRAVLPQLNNWRKAHEEKLVVIGLSTETEAELSAADEPKPEFALGSDPAGKLAGTLGVTALPYAILIDPQGIVRFQGHPAALDNTKVQAVLALAAR